MHRKNLVGPWVAAPLLLFCFAAGCAGMAQYIPPSPFIRAVHEGDYDRVHSALRADSGLARARSLHWGTALGAAADGGHLDIVMLLLDHGARPNDRGSDGTTALTCAVSGGNPDVVDELLRRRATLGARPTHGQTHLHVAAIGGSASEVELMIRRSPGDMGVRDGAGATPLHYAALGASGESVLSAALGASGVSGEAGLRKAKCVAVLTRYGAHPDAADRHGETPLHWAVRTLCSETAESLLASGADVNARDNKGRTPLATVDRGPLPFAQQRERRERLRRCLLAHGATSKTTSATAWSRSPRASTPGGRN